MTNTYVLLDLHQHIYFYSGVSCGITGVNGRGISAEYLRSTRRINKTTNKTSLFPPCFVWYLGDSSRNPPRQVQERWRLLLNFLHCILEAAPRESGEAAAAEPSRAEDEWTHGPRRLSLRTEKPQKGERRGGRSIGYTPV